MKLTFLGTSHGVPAADRYCASTMIEAGGATYIVDGGAPLIDILLRRGVDLDSIRAVFATHMHGDHVNGLLPFVDLLNWYFRTVSVDIFLTEPRGIELFKDLIALMEGGPLDEARLRFRLMTADLVYDDWRVRVTPLPTRHMAAQNRPSFSYLFEADGRRALLTGDLSGGLKERDFPALALQEPLDLVVCEMAHFDVPDVLPWLERCQAKAVMFNHVFPLDKLDRINALDGRFGYPIRTLEDGDVIEL